MGSVQSGKIGRIGRVATVNGRGEVMAVKDMQRNDAHDVG